MLDSSAESNLTGYGVLLGCLCLNDRKRLTGRYECLDASSASVVFFLTSQRCKLYFPDLKFLWRMLNFFNRAEFQNYTSFSPLCPDGIWGFIELTSTGMCYLLIDVPLLLKSASEFVIRRNRRHSKASQFKNLPSRLNQMIQGNVAWYIVVL